LGQKDALPQDIERIRAMMPTRFDNLDIDLSKLSDEELFQEESTPKLGKTFSIEQCSAESIKIMSDVLNPKNYDVMVISGGEPLITNITRLAVYVPDLDAYTMHFKLSVPWMHHLPGLPIKTAVWEGILSAKEASCYDARDLLGEAMHYFNEVQNIPCCLLPEEMQLGFIQTPTAPMIEWAAKNKDLPAHIRQAALKQYVKIKL
jgi:hypothetical protein